VAGTQWTVSVAVAAGLGAVLSGCDDLQLTFDEGSGDAGMPDGGTTDGSTDEGTGAPVDEVDPRYGTGGPVTFDATLDEEFLGLTEVQVRYEVTGTDFYRAPWPSNARRRADGAPAMQDFPNPADIELLDAYVEVIEGNADGFSNLPVVYAGLVGELPAAALPAPPDTLQTQSVVQLVGVGPTNCGERVPLALALAEGDGYVPAGTLQATPLDGWVLPPATDWAFVVLRMLGTNQGVTVPPPPFFREALVGAGNDAWSQSLQPLRDCLPALELDPSLISFATVFTTQDPVRETRLMRQVALESADAPTVVSWQEEPEFSNAQYTTYGGRFLAPIFQEGITPYAVIGDGGGLVFDAAGLPVVQRYEEVPFSIAFPNNADGPLPVMVWEDGTAVSATDDRRVQFGHVGDDPFKEAIERGFAVANFQPQFHAGRSGPAADEVLHSFNFLNPESGRTAFRQQVVDTSTFIRLLDTAQASFDGVPELDTTRMVYGGHSQGAIVGAMVAGLEDRFLAYMLNGVGAVLGTVIVERRDPIDINRTLSGVLGLAGGRLDRFHPVVQLAQLGADPVDPANYVRLWRGWAEHPQGNSVFMSNGFNDDTTHHTQIAAITIAADASPIQPAGWDVDPFDLWGRPEVTRPVFGNQRSINDSPLTIVSYLDADQGHFTIYRVAAVMTMGAEFWLSALDGVPVVPR